MTLLYIINVSLVIFAIQNYFVSQNEILPVLTDRPALFVETDLRIETVLSV